MCIHPKGHRFQKFDEASLFCERCGERRVIAAPQNPWWTTPQVYYPYPNHWYQPWMPPYTVWSMSDVGSSTYTFDVNAANTTVTNAIAGPQIATPRGVTRT